MSLKNKRKQETNEEFIQRWKEHECLWDVRNLSYHNRASRELARKKLADSCGMTEEEAQGKMNNLRTYFTKELAALTSKKQTNDVGDDVIPTSKWRHFRSMLFLKDVITHRKSPSFIGDPSERRCNFTSNEDIEDIDIFLDDDDEEETTTPTFVEQTQSKPQQMTSLERTAVKDVNIKTNTPKKSECECGVNNVLDKATNLLKVLRQSDSREREDPSTTFGRYVAHELRDIHDDTLRQYIKFQIQQLFFNARFDQIAVPRGQSTVQPHAATSHPIVAQTYSGTNIPPPQKRRHTRSPDHTNTITEDSYSQPILVVKQQEIL